MAAPDLAHEIDLGADLGRLLHVHAAENRGVFVDTRLHRDRSLAVAVRDHQAAPANVNLRTRLGRDSRYISERNETTWGVERDEQAA